MPGSSKTPISYFEAIQLVSLSNLYNFRDDKPTSHEYDMNRIFRKYSKTFYTPLHVVKNELPLHQVITAYFDDLFENMDQDELEQVRLDLIKTAEERAQDKDANDTEELSIFEDMQMLAEEAQAAVQKMAEQVKSGIKPLVSNKGEVPLESPLLKQKMPDIKMKFLSPSEMEAKINAEDEGLGLLDP